MELILKYFPNLSKEQIEQFSQLQSIYEEWNAKINVISRKDINALYINHILHSLSIAKVVQFHANTHILDVGTGGGFPGIPLAILFPQCNFYLVDSILKKITVVNEVVNQLNIKNVKSQQIRAEKVNQRFDFVVSRAVTQMPVFYNWVKNKITPNSKHQLKNGILYLKGGDLSEELKTFKNQKTFEITTYFEEAFFETKKVVHIPIGL